MNCGIAAREATLECPALRFWLNLYAKEIPHDFRALRGEDGFRMKLHAVNRHGLMLYGHDLADFIAGDDLEAIRQRIRCGDQRMIARYHRLFRQTLEQRLVGIHLYNALLAVHELLRMLNFTAERFADGLMAEAHAKNRDAAAEPAYHFLTDARVLRVAGSAPPYGSG